MTGPVPIKTQAHAEYMLQTLLYIARLINEGDMGQLKNLGLDREQALKIAALPLEGLHHLALSLRANLLKLEFDPAVLDRAFDIQSRKRDERKTIYELVTKGASHPVMAQLFGLNKNEFSQIRKELGLSDIDIGRCELPDITVQQHIWSAWQHNAELDDPLRLLRVNQLTGIKIRVIWTLLMQWSDDGLTPPVLSPEQLATHLTLQSFHHGTKPSTTTRLMENSH